VKARDIGAGKATALPRAAFSTDEVMRIATTKITDDPIAMVR
jgi:hypothetical protein